MSGIAWIIGTAAVGVFLLLAAPLRGRFRLAGAALVGGAAVAGAFVLPSDPDWWPDAGLLPTLLLLPLAAVVGGALWTTTAASPSRAVRGFTLLAAGNCTTFAMLEAYGAALASLVLIPACWLWPFARIARRTLSEGDGLRLAAERSAAPESNSAASMPHVPRALEPGLACAMGALLATGLLTAATNLTAAPDERDPEQRARRILRERERRAARLADDAENGTVARNAWADQVPTLGVGAVVIVCGALGAADVVRRFPAPKAADPRRPDIVPVPSDRIELPAPTDAPVATAEPQVRDGADSDCSDAADAADRPDVSPDPSAPRKGDA